ncbi:unnamed protein product [Sphacelaria rigidula]
MGTKLNPAAAAHYPALRHCHGKHVDRDETRPSKYQIRWTGDSDRRRIGRLHPPCETNKQGKYCDRRAEGKPEQKKLARKIRRRNRPKRRAKQRERRVNIEKAKARSRSGKLKVATYIVRTLSLTGKNGAGHAEVVLSGSRV